MYLSRVVDVKLFVFPPGNGGVGFHRVVILDRCDVGLFEFDLGAGQGLCRIATLLAR